jgi:ribosomal protein S27AE
MNHGGGGAVKHSEKAKKKISEAKKGKALPQEHRRKLSESQKGKTHSEESRRKMSESKQGKTLSEEHCRKMSEAAKNKPKSECPHCGKLVAANMMKRWHGDNCKHRDTTLSSVE